MTKVIILGQEPKEEKKLKPIEFLFKDTGRKDGRRTETTNKPSDFKNVEVLSIGFPNDNYLDIFFAYDNDRVGGSVFYGHFNDGVVE